MWYLPLLVEKRFKFESNFCNGCGYLMQKAMNLTDVSIVSIKGIVYRINFWLMSKDDAINLMKNSDSNEKGGLLSIFLLCIKDESQN